MINNRSEKLTERNQVFLKKLLFPYHPSFQQKSLSQLKLVCSLSDVLDIPRLVEEVMAHHGQLQREDVEGRDFSDGSECKMISLRQVSNSPNSFMATVRNVYGKTGSVRLVIYNIVSNDLDYFFLPKERLADLISCPSRFSLDDHARRRMYSSIHISFNKITGRYNLGEFQVASFLDLMNQQN